MLKYMLKAKSDTNHVSFFINKLLSYCIVSGVVSVVAVDCANRRLASLRDRRSSRRPAGRLRHRVRHQHGPQDHYQHSQLLPAARAHVRSLHQDFR